MGILRKKKAAPAVEVVEEVEAEVTDLTEPQVASEPKKSFDERTGKLPWQG